MASAPNKLSREPPSNPAVGDQKHDGQATKTEEAVLKAKEGLKSLFRKGSKPAKEVEAMRPEEALRIAKHTEVASKALDLFLAKKRK